MGSLCIIKSGDSLPADFFISDSSSDSTFADGTIGVTNSPAAAVVTGGVVDMKEVVVDIPIESKEDELSWEEIESMLDAHFAKLDLENSLENQDLLTLFENQDPLTLFADSDSEESELQSSDSTFADGTSGVNSSPAAAVGTGGLVDMKEEVVDIPIESKEDDPSEEENLADPPTLPAESFDSTLRDGTSGVTGGLVDMNEHVVDILVGSKEDFWNSDELFSTAKDFFDWSLRTLCFCTSLKDCLKNLTVISQFETLEQFKRFDTLEGAFSEEFCELFQSVYKQQLSMFRKLQIQKGKVDKMLKSAKVWTRLTNVIFVITFIAVLACSVVAAAVSAPTLLTALAGAGVVLLPLMWPWINSLWKKSETKLKGQREMIKLMQMGNYIVIKDLGNIKALVDKLGIEMQGLVRNAQFAINEEEKEAVATAVDEMKKTVNDFAKTIDELSDHSDKCSRDVRRASTLIVQNIARQHSGSV